MRSHPLSTIFVIVLSIACHGTVHGFAVNPGDSGPYPGRPGMVTGYGSSKSEAYNNALRKLPRGTREGRPTYAEQRGSGVTCELHYAQRGHVRGEGKTKADAHAAAMAKIPRGANADDVSYTKEGQRHICKIRYAARGHVKGSGDNRQAAYRNATTKLPRGAEPGRVDYRDGGGKGGWACDLPYVPY